MFPLLWMIVFTKKHEETIYLCSRYVGVDSFLCFTIMLTISLILEDFIYSEKDIRKLGCVLKKRYIGLIYGT